MVLDCRECDRRCRGAVLKRRNAGGCDADLQYLVELAVLPAIKLRVLCMAACIIGRVCDAVLRLRCTLLMLAGTSLVMRVCDKARFQQDVESIAEGVASRPYREKKKSVSGNCFTRGIQFCIQSCRPYCRPAKQLCTSCACLPPALLSGCFTSHAAVLHADGLSSFA